jgi:hypothetical protein
MASPNRLAGVRDPLRSSEPMCRWWVRAPVLSLIDIAERNGVDSLRRLASADRLNELATRRPVLSLKDSGLQIHAIALAHHRCRPTLTSSLPAHCHLFCPSTRVGSGASYARRTPAACLLASVLPEGRSMLCDRGRIGSVTASRFLKSRRPPLTAGTNAGLPVDQADWRRGVEYSTLAHAGPVGGG